MGNSAVRSELEELFRLHQEHSNNFFDGDPELEHWAHDEGVTLHGGFGFSARGWDEVRPGLIRAAGRLTEGQMKFTPIGGQVAGDLAYVAGLEEGTVRVDGGERRPMRLKVTMVFRKENGSWKRVHRHGEIVRDVGSGGSVGADAAVS